MSEKINQYQQHSEPPQMLVERFGLDIDKPPIALTDQEVEQIRGELGGWAKAHLEALAVFLEGKWDPEEYKEKLKKTGGRYTPDTYFDVNPNVRIALDGHVIYKKLDIVMNAPRRNDGKHLWKLKWQSGYDIQIFTNKFEEFRDLIEDAKKDGLEIPKIVQEYFDSIKRQHEETEVAFEKGKKWTGIFSLSEKNTNPYAFNTENPPESFEIGITLKDGGDPLQANSWRLIVDGLDGGVISVAQEGQSYCLKFDAAEGDETGGVFYVGEILIDPTLMKIIEGTLSYDHSHPDGGCDGYYKIADTDL